MKTKSRILAVILTLAMTFSMLPMTALAAELVGPPQNQQLVAGPPKGEAGPTTGDPEVVPPTVPGPTDDTTPVAPPAEPPAPPAENPGPVGPHDPGAGPRAPGPDDVAQIGETGYATFADALDAANANDDATTITLLKDCTYAGGGTISHALTIEGDSKTLTMNNGDSYAYINVQSTGDTVINNLTIKSEVPDGKADVFHVKSKLTMTGCTVNTNKPENGIFNITLTGSVAMNSGTLNTTGFITNAGKGLSLKTGDGTNGVNITGGTIRLEKGAFITLLADSAATTNTFKIQPSESLNWAQNAAAGDVLLNGSAATAHLDDIAAKITIGNEKSWNVAKGSDANANNLVMHQLDSIKYVHAQHDMGTNDGSLANPYKTLQAAYNALPEAGGEIRVLYDMTTETALNCTAAKTVTITSAYRFNNISLRPDYPASNEGWTITRGSTLKTEMLNITNGTVTLNHITLDGNNVANVTAPLVSVAASKTLTLGDGATLQNNTTTGDHTTSLGGAIATAGTLTMNTGAVIKDSSAYYGGGVFVNGAGVFNMAGGTISGCTTLSGGSGGAICIQPKSDTTGAVNISGGEITGNTAAVYGGAIHGGQKAGTIAITGTANIHGNRSTNGYAVYPYSSTVTVGGTAQITGNTNGAGKPSNVTGKFAIDTNLADGANIGVTGNVGDDVSTASAVEGDAAFVHSDDPKLSVKYESSGTKLTLVAEPHYYVKADAPAGGNGSFNAPFQTLNQAVTEAVEDTSAEIRLLSNVDVTAQNNFTGDDNVTICSADPATGVPTTDDGARFKLIRKTPTMLQLFGSSVVTLKEVIVTEVGGSTNENNSPLVVGNAAAGNESAKLVLDNGATVTDTSGNFSAVYLFAGNLEMKPGSLITKHNNRGGVPNLSADPAQGAGGGVTVGGIQPAHLKMSGGTITGNTAYTGGGVYVVNGDVTIQGAANISGNHQAGGVPSNVFLKGSQTLKLSGALTSDANIGVYVQTPPTVAGDTKPVAVSDGIYTVQAADAAYVHSDNGGDAIVQFTGSGDAAKLVLKKLVADVYVKSDGNDAAPGTGAKEHPYKTLAKAYAEVATGGTIHVMDGLDPVTATTTFNVDKTITLESCKTDGGVWDVDTDTHTIKRNAGFVATMLDITAGNVTMKHLVLDGVGGLMNGVGTHGDDATPVDATAPLVRVYSDTKAPTLTLSDGAVLQNNNTTTKGCAGIKVGSGAAKYGNLNIQTGAKIQYNQTGGTAEDYSSGCAVYVRGSHTQFAMTGGEISHNSGEAYATVNFYTNKLGGNAVISGGSITANTCTKGSGTGGILLDENGMLTITGGSITGNIGPRGGIAFWDNTGALNMGGGAAINITGNKTSGNVVRNVYLNTDSENIIKINLISHLTADSTIGVYSTATPTPGHPVLVATGANATDATYFTSDNLVGAGIRAAKSGDPDRTGIYLDVAEKMKAKIIYVEGEKLYKTFDEAIKAITDDSSANSLDDASSNYKIELLADCTTNGAFPVENITMESTSGQHYTLMVKNYITTAGGTFTAKDIKFADATPQHEWLQAKAPWTFTGCELPNFAVVGVTVTLDTGTVVSGNIRIDSNPAGNLAIKAGNVPVNGTISINNATSKITLLADSTATSRYNVQYASTIELLTDGTKVIMDGTALADAATATAIAKLVTVSGGNDPTKVWVAVGSSKNVVLKPAKAFYVSESGNDSSGAGTYANPYKTIAKAYGQAGEETGLDIRVLSDLPDTAATTLSNAAVSFVKISSYQNELTPATAPWKITRGSGTGALLAITEGNVNLTNITLDGKGDTLASDTALVTVDADSALTLDDKATLQNNKYTTDAGLGGGVAVSGTLTMNSGSTITGNTLTGGGSTYGGGVYVADAATFQMNGGTISNNTITSPGGSGGGIMVDPDGTTATVRIGGDALITGNSCGANGAAIHGGAAGSTVAISGNAKITGNRINAAGYVGAAVYPHNGSLVLSDGVQITGNSNQNGNACNVYLGDTKTLTIGGAHMGAGSSVGVYCQTMPDAPGETVDIATNAVETDKGHFFSDKSSEAGIKFDGDKVVLAYDARYIPQPTRPDPDKPDPGVTVEPGPGKVTTWPKNPDPGTKVTITIEPETGWEIDKVIIVTVPGGEPVVITGTDPITYIAPDPNTVKITVKYKRIPVDPKISGVSKLLNCDDHIAYMVGVPGGNFDPTRGITRGETAQMFYNLLRNKDIGAVAKFSDVEADAWYADAVNALAALQIIEGRGADAFDPSANTSRAEFTAIAMRFAIATKGEVTFTDVPGDYWAESAISGAAQYGWIMGYADGSFKPQADITRAEAAKVVNTMLGRFPDKKFIDGATGLKVFPDVKKDYWAFYQIAEATNAHNYTKVKNAETWTK